MSVIIPRDHTQIENAPRCHITPLSWAADDGWAQCRFVVASQRAILVSDGEVSTRMDTPVVLAFLLDNRSWPSLCVMTGSALYHHTSEWERRAIAHEFLRRYITHRSEPHEL